MRELSRESRMLSRSEASSAMTRIVLILRPGRHSLSGLEKSCRTGIVQATPDCSRQGQRLKRLLEKVHALAQIGLLSSQLEAIFTGINNLEPRFLLLHLPGQFLAVHTVGQHDVREQ